MSVPTDGLRDKRPQFLQVFQSEYDHFQAIPKGARAYAMAVYMCLASHANSKTDTVFPSHATICDHTGLSKNTVLKALDALTASGHISVQPRFKKGERTSNLYTLLVVVQDVNPQDTVVHETNDPVHDANGVVHDVTQVGRHVNSTQTKEPDQGTRPIEPGDAPPVALRATSPTGERVRPPSSINMTTPPDEISAMLRAALRRAK